MSNGGLLWGWIVTLISEGHGVAVTLALGCASCGPGVASAPAGPTLDASVPCARCSTGATASVSLDAPDVTTAAAPVAPVVRVVRASGSGAQFLRVSRRLNRLRRRAARETSGRPVRDAGAGSDPCARLQGFLPSGAGQRATVTFAAWGGGHRGVMSSVETSADGTGRLVVAGIAAVAAAFAVADDGTTVMVQVVSFGEDAPAPEPQTIRAWVLSGGRIRAVDGTTLRENFQIAGHTDEEQDRVRFETGWPVTGRAGGAKNVAGRRSTFIAA